MSEINNYDDLQEKLSDYINEHGLDEVTVSSLFRSSIEFLEPEIQPASFVVLDSTTFDGAKSIKLSNVKIDIKFALDAIFTIKPIMTEKSLWLVLLVLKAIVTIMHAAMVDLSTTDAIVLFSIYRLRSADVNDIEKFIVNETVMKAENITRKDIENSLSNLEKLGTVVMLDGAYKLAEAVIIKS